MTLGQEEDARLDMALVLVARPAAEGLGQALDRQRAVVSFALAALERGLDIVTTADSDAASLIAQAALPHSVGHGAEQIRSTARVHVAETGGRDEFARGTLAPFMRRAAITYRSQDRQQIEIPLDSEDSHGISGATHPLFPWLSEIVPTIGLVMVCPSGNDLDMAAEWPQDILRGAFCADRDVASRAREIDPSEHLLARLDLSADEFNPDDLLQGGRSHPIGVMSELLLDEWLDRYRERSDD